MYELCLLFTALPIPRYCRVVEIVYQDGKWQSVDVLSTQATPTVPLHDSMKPSATENGRVH